MWYKELTTYFQGFHNKTKKKAFKVTNKYAYEYKVQTVKLGKEIDIAKVAKSLGIQEKIIYYLAESYRS